MKKILLIEDEVLLAEVYTVFFEIQGYTVVWASDGEEGLLKAAESDPDIILVDMMMPILDGLGFLQRYQANKPAKVKIILLSNMQSPEYEARAFALGVERYEVKSSLAPQQLLAIVEEVLADSKDK